VEEEKPLDPSEGAGEALLSLMQAVEVLGIKKVLVVGEVPIILQEVEVINRPSLLSHQSRRH
jgi:hypothetical protein